MQLVTKDTSLFAPGHTACAGCGGVLAIHQTLRVLGSDIIVVNATSCMEIVSSRYPYSSWRVPYIHGNFENASSIATGVVTQLRVNGNDHTKVVVIAGDGSTYDIGVGPLSGMLERNDDVLYICYDNEAYMNTGIQRSSSTPKFAATTTTQIGSKIHGKQTEKKPIIEIAAAHNIPYAASASIAFAQDYENKLKKAIAINGAKFITVHAPCVPGWDYPSNMTLNMARLAVQTGIWPLYEIVDGKTKLTMVPPQLKPVADYLGTQKRFKHLTADEMKIIQDAVTARFEKMKKSQ
jgi:pyruvate ferredoxin oxidoreductase beta subunit